MRHIINQAKHRNHEKAFSLIETMIAAVVLMIVMGSIMMFRYYTVVSAERAENQLMAARCAYLLSEAWKGQKGDPAFDPTEQDFDLDFTIQSMTSPDLLGSFPSGSYGEKLEAKADVSVLGNYRVQIDDKEFQTQLLYGELSGVDNLNLIHVLVVWKDYRGMRYEYYLPTLAQS